MAAQSPLLPRFVDHDLVHEADSCRPLRAAVESGEARLDALSRGQYPGRPLGRDELPGLCTIGNWDLVGKQHWGLPWHRNEGIEITFLETGRHFFQTDCSAGFLKPDDLTITRPWQPHALGKPLLDAGRLHWLILDVGVRHPNHAWKWPKWVVLETAVLSRLTELLRYNEQPVLRAGEDIGRCFRKIATALRGGASPAPNPWLVLLINELLLLVLELLERADLPLDQTLSSTARTVELFLDDLTRSAQSLAMPWTLESMAAECSLGPTHFTDHCKRLKNDTPVRFLNRCRLERAARLLLNSPQRRIAAIAFEVGFSSSQYFANAFRQQFGLTPTSFRCQSEEGTGRIH